MLSPMEPLNTRDPEINPFSTRPPVNADPNNPSPLMKRRMNLEKLDVKTYSGREFSKDLPLETLPPTTDKEEDPSQETNAREETKVEPVSSSSKPPEQIPLTENNGTNFPQPQFGPVSQEWLLRNQEDGSQSPYPARRLVMAPLEFSLMPENESLRADRGESNQTYGGLDSPKSISSAQLAHQMKGPSRFTNDYEIIEILGKGSFGKVYKCINKLDRKEYAVKETIRKFIGRYKAYGLNEMKALAQLTALEDNADVVRYYHSWVEDDKLFLVMEYCPSTLTKQRADKGQFSENELKNIARDICLGLSYLHRNNLVHLDVKTENVLISNTNRYKLGDMGQTKELDSSSDLDEGDCRYQAPEFMNSNIPKAERDYKKVDIFSLGMTLYELATNHDLPKNGAEWRQLRNEEFHRLQEVNHLSRSFKNLVELMLKKDPSQRPTAQDLLDKYLQSEEERNQKWENIVGDLLEKEKRELEALQAQKESNKRRKSFS